MELQHKFHMFFLRLLDIELILQCLRCNLFGLQTASTANGAMLNADLIRTVGLSNLGVSCLVLHACLHLCGGQRRLQWVWRWGVLAGFLRQQEHGVIVG